MMYSVKAFDDGVVSLKVILIALAKSLWANGCMIYSVEPLMVV